MSDVANILGGIKDASAPTKPPPRPKGHHPSRAAQMTAVPKEMREVVLGKHPDPDSAPLPPIVPTFAPGANADQPEQMTAQQDDVNIPKAQQTVKVGNKWISTQKPARKWIWANFASSARNDGLLLNHWVRAEVEYPDYPYAKFDIHLDPISYSDEEYFAKLQHEDWTKSETDHLMELARIFELRWPVIYDRWFERYHYQVDVSNANLANKTTTHTDKDDSEEAKEGETKSAEKDTPSQQQSQHQQPAVAIVSRNIEDLQHRYYSVAAILMQHRIAQEAAAEVKALEGATPDATGIADPKAAADQLLRDTAVARTVAAGDPKHQPLIQNLGTGASNKIFDLTYEKERRSHLEKMWHRTKEEEEEEAQLRKELRLVETQLRKLKKAGGHLIAAADSTSKANSAKKAAAAGAAAAPATSAASSRNASRSASPAPEAPDDDGVEVTSNAELLDKAFAYTAPVPTPGTPYLQSGRLAPPAIDGAMGLNKTMLARMDAVLTDLKIPPRPLPTKRVCDLYDSVRKDAVTLLTLQKMLLQKEGQLQAKRVKFAKMGGTIQVADEETALGIPKPKPAPVPTTPAVAPTVAVASTTASKPKGQRTGGKGKGASTGGGKGNRAAASKTVKTAATAVSDLTKTADTAKAKSVDTKAKGGDAKSKASDAKPKAGSTPTAATAKTGTAAGGGKQAPGAGKQGPTGKQAAGGKQTRKPSTKRKRKAEAKTPSAAAAAASIGASSGAAAPTLKAPPAAAAAAPKAAPVAGAPGPAPSKTEAAGETKAGKKRARKS